MKEVIKIKVRGYHLDIYGHVNNARYLEFLEEARWEYFERHNLLEVVAEQKLAFVLVNININYRRPGFPNDILEVHTHTRKVGQRSCIIEQEIFLEGSDVIVADAAITFVLMDMESNKAVDITGPTRDKLERLTDSH
ncbi:MAG: YbgC/FadM family acyl-CoA thioesterase [Hahellaceae bacterium]|nr:YbgC/FadM family acyl-CoA thioesterase [Hahellaceae bacterium]